MSKRVSRIMAVVVLVVYLCQQLIFPLAVVYAEDTVPEPPPTETVVETISEPTQPAAEPEPPPTETPEQITNTAEVEASVTTTANSGENTIEGPAEEQVASTGDTAAIANSETTGNLTELEVAAPVAEITNEADVTQTTESESVSGQNTLTGSTEEATVTTGDTTAVANEVNLINTNVVASAAEVLFLDILNSQTGDINLRDLWMAFQNQTPAAPTDTPTDPDLNVTLSNEATVNVSTEALAVSGQNSITEAAGDSQITTGNTLAVANLINFVNTNLVGSQMFLSVINIFAYYDGNIILPSIERFSENLGLTETPLPESLTINDTAEVTNDVLALADTGNNSLTTQATSEVTTGDALAVATNSNYLNYTSLFSQWYLLMLNNLGVWDGQIANMNQPGTQTAPSGNNTYDYRDESQNLETLGGEIDITNNANVTAKASAVAISGQNQSESVGDGIIQTGHSTALANIVNFVNVNLIGGKLFLPIINLLGSWKGDLIFAYPTLAVNIAADKEMVRPGETINYTVSYQNLGHEEARNSHLQINLPEAVELMSAGGGNYSQDGQTLDLSLGTLGPKQTGSFNYTVRAKDPDLITQIEPTFWEKLTAKLIKPVMAAENESFLNTLAQIGTPDSQADTSKNTSSNTVRLVYDSLNSEQTSGTESVDDSQNNTTEYPQLEITAEENVAEFVYPEDYITYTITIRNTGSGTALDTVLYSDITDGTNRLTGQAFEIGEIPGGQSRKLTYGLQVPSALSGGNYYNYFVAKAIARDDSEVQSNEFGTEFMVKLRGMSLAPAVMAAERKEKKVLGAKTSNPPQCPADNDLPYWLLIVITCLLYLMERRKRRQIEKELQLILRRLERKMK